MTVEVALHQPLVGLDDGVEELLAVFRHLVGQLGRDLAGLALLAALRARVGGQVDQVDDPGQLVLAADRQVDGDAAVGELRAERLENPEEVGTLAIEHVHDDDAREIEIGGAVPHAARAHLDPHHAADDDERALDDAEGVDEVDLAPLPVRVADRGGERHLPLVLLVVPVRDGRALLDRAEPVDGAGLEEDRLNERRLPGSAMADDGDVANLPGLDYRHEGTLLVRRRFRVGRLAPALFVGASVLLYDSAVSGNCYKVRLLFAHLGLPYERSPVDVVDRSDRPELLGGLNPALRVPTLILDDGRPLAESNAILWYFGEGTRFVPDDRYKRAQVLQWQFFEQYDHEPSIAVVRFWIAYSGRPEAFADRLEERMAAGYRALGAMERHLDGRDWLVGRDFTLADISLYAYTHVAHEGGFDLEPYPAVRAWLDRVAAEPGHVPISD